VLRRHEVDVTRLTLVEQMEFWPLLARVRRALDTLFAPDHYNYAFLMNENRHIHLHVIPRYAEFRYFAGLTFEDGQLNSHYQLSRRIVDPEVRAQLALVLGKALNND
jgi:diadenosine tetraphosphate (Ap4A) HIT family hydrolase